MCSVQEISMLESTYYGTEHKKKIRLLFENKHCQLITSMMGFLDTSYYCESCDKGYDNQNHKYPAEKSCKFCHRTNCQYKTRKRPYSLYKCIDCYRVFTTIECRTAHSENKEAKG